MKSTALILLFFFISTSSDYAAEQGGTRHPSNFSGGSACDKDLKVAANNFAAKACYVANYDPSRQPFGPGYVRPHCDENPKVNESQQAALANAFLRAPNYAQDRLCRLTNFYLVKPPLKKELDWNSWGLWEGRDRKPGTGVFVAISDQYLTSESIAGEENQTVEQLLGIADGRRPRLPRLQTDPGLTILGAVAHELGHALLADANADGTDAHHPRRKVSEKPESDCFEHAILDSWDADAFHKHMRRWVKFGDPNHNVPKYLRLNLQKLRSDVAKGKFESASNAISGVYRGEEFVSFFAVFSPEEDFVETYRYKVISDAAGTQSITFPLLDREVNVLERLKSGRLADKVDCLKQLGLLSPLP